MNKNKVLWGVVIVVVLIIVIYAFRNQGPSGNKIKIGVIIPLTGDAAVYGEPLLKVVLLATDEINTQGGINGKQVQIIAEDGKCTGATAASAMQKLVSIDQVQVVIGGFCSSESLAAVPIATQNKVLLLSGGSSSPKLTNASLYFFRDYPSDASQGKILADAAYNKKNWRSVAFIQEQTDYALGIYNAFSQNFQSLGGNTTNEAFSSDVTDFRSILTKLRAQKPNTLFIDTQTSQAADRILKQLQELGWNPPILVSDVVPGDPATMKADAKALEGALAAEFGFDSTNPKFQHLLQAYKFKYNAELPYQSYSQTMYDAVYILRDGIAAVGYDGEKLAAWSRTISNWAGASGLITIQPDGDRASGHRLEVIHDGTAQPL